MNEPSSDDLRTIWQQLSRRNEWQLVDDEEDFLQQVAAQWRTLTKVKTSSARNRLAVERTYAARLCEMLRRRHDRAWDELGQAFVRTALRASVPQPEAVELAQSACVGVWERLPTLKNPHSLFSYAFKIFRTVWREHRAAIQHEEPFRSTPEGTLLDDPVDERNLTSEAEQQIVTAELLALLQAALPNSRERIVVLRTAILQENPRDVARDLNIPLTQARVDKYRGLARLRGNPRFMQQLRDLVGEVVESRGRHSDDQ